MKFPKRKGVNSRYNFFIAVSPPVGKRKNETGGHKHHKKHESKKKAHYPIQRFKQVVPIDGSDYIMELSLTWDEIYKFRKRHINCTKEPDLQVRDNKATELKDEFSSYCGVKKRIKNWLYYV